MMSSTSSLRFVRSGDEDEEGSLMKEAVEAVRQKEGTVQWVQARSLKREKGCIYVLGDFNNKQFKSLEGKCRMIGPSVVLSHIQHGWPFPASTQPVHSMAMHGVIACFTQAGDKEKREKLTRLIKMMGGRVDGNFTKRVTHLVAGQIGSDKYHVARKLHLPVLLPSWVESCWEDRLRSATDPAVLTQHCCPPFTGCVVTVTGLDEGVRARVKEACQANGGKYSGELTKGVCTHLLVGSKTSAKFKFAQQWGMKCVGPEWFHDSLDAGYCMPEDLYTVDSGGGAKGRSLTKPVTKSADVPEWASSLEAFNIPMVTEEECLKNCKVFPSGLTEAQERKAVSVLNQVGGVILSQLSDAVTHVVMGEKQAAVLDRAKEAGVEVVNVQWLLDCCAGGKRLPEQTYSLLPHTEDKAKTSQKRAPEKSEAIPVAKRLRLHDDDDDMEDEDDIMKQYASHPQGEGEETHPQEEEMHPLTSGVLSGCGGVCVSKLFSQEDYAIAVRVVRENGGTVVQPPSAQYLIAPLEWVRSKQKEVESELEKQRSIEAGTLLDPTSYFLFQPLTTPISSSTLVDCVLAFSQFSDLEREHLIRFSRGLGAVVQDHFARYPAHGLLASTHLILKRAEGTKFTSALKWGVPAVADSWLFECAKARQLVSVEPHLLANQHPPPVTSEGVGAGPEEAQGVEDGGNGEQGDQEMEVEDKEQGEAQLPLTDVVICFHKKLTSSGNLQDVATALGATCHSKLDDMVTHYVYQGKATEAVREREVKLARERGCHVVSPHWLLQCQQTQSRPPEADYPMTFNPSMALNMLVPLSQVAARQDLQPPTSSSPASSAHTTGTSDEDNDDSDDNMTSDPSEAVRQLHQHLDELNEAPQVPVKRRRSRRLQNKETSSDPPAPPTLPLPPSAATPLAGPRTPRKRQGHHTHHQHHRHGRRGRGKEEAGTDSQVSDSQLQQVTYDDPEGRREKAKLLARIEREEELLAQGISPRRLAAERRGDGKEGEEEGPGKGELTLELPPLGEDQPGPPPGVKRPPTKISANVKRKVDSVPPPPQEGRGGGDVVEPPPIGVPIVTHAASKPNDAQPLYDQRSRLTRAHKPKFLLSSLEQREKIDYGALIQELGGEYIDQDYFTPKCTHLVVGKASRTEKYLGACAAGKWVLHKSYLEACRSAKQFVWEEGHEWGEQGEGGNPLESAPRRWRLQLAQKQAERGRRGEEKRAGEGAFAGWKVLVFAEKAKLPGLKRLLEAGGATVVGSHTPSALKGVTHAFITINYFPKDSLSLQSLVSQGVECLRPDYIAEFLSKGNTVSTEPFLLNEVRGLSK